MRNINLVPVFPLFSYILHIYKFPESYYLVLKKYMSFNYTFYIDLFFIRAILQFSWESQPRFYLRLSREISSLCYICFRPLVCALTRSDLHFSWPFTEHLSMAKTRMSLSVIRGPWPPPYNLPQNLHATL